MWFRDRPTVIVQRLEGYVLLYALLFYSYLMHFIHLNQCTKPLLQPLAALCSSYFTDETSHLLLFCCAHSFFEQNEFVICLYSCWQFFVLFVSSVCVYGVQSSEFDTFCDTMYETNSEMKLKYFNPNWCKIYEPYIFFTYNNKIRVINLCNFSNHKVWNLF